MPHPILLVGTLAAAHAKAPAVPPLWLRTGVTLPYAVQPGGTAVLSADIASWERGPRTMRLAVGPRLSLFGRPQNHRSALVGAETSLRWTRPQTGRFVSVDAGLGWLGQHQVTAVAVDLGTGELDRSRTLYHHLLPTVGMHLGRSWPSGWGWYGGAAAGRHLSPQTPDALWFNLEAGLRVGFGGGAR